MKPILIIQNWLEESPGTITDYLNEREIPYVVVKTFEGESLPAVDDISSTILLGYPGAVSKYNDYKGHPEVYRLISEIVHHNRPLLAICYGSQLLARVLGAQVKPNGVKELGVYEVALTEEGINDPLFSGIDKQFEVLEWHGDTFRLPFGATHLAKSEDCAMQAFRSRNQVGIQFHPEPKPEEIPLWCDMSKDELSEVGKSKSEIVSSFNESAESIKSLNYRLIENFLNQ